MLTPQSGAFQQGCRIPKAVRQQHPRHRNTYTCMAGCDRPCTVAYHANRKATYLFGDIEPETPDIENLVDFARQYAHLHDGWCSSVDRPGKLRRTTLARVPAAIIALEDTGESVA